MREWARLIGRLSRSITIRNCESLKVRKAGLPPLLDKNPGHLDRIYRIDLSS
jgi:hypothetical protein